MGVEHAWRLARRDRWECRHRVGEATRPPAYAPHDSLIALLNNGYLEGQRVSIRGVEPTVKVNVELFHA